MTKHQGSDETSKRSASLRTFLRLVLGLFLATVFLVGAGVAWQWFAQDTPIQVSESTTFLLQPVRSDGLIDYAAAHHQQRSSAIAKSSNGAPSFFAAMKTEWDDSPHQDALESWFADEANAPMASLPSHPYSDDEFLDWLTDLAEADEIARMMFLDAASSIWHLLQRKPWADSDCPPMAALLQQHRPAIEALVDAAECKGMYIPLRESLGLPAGNEPDVRYPMAIGTANEWLHIAAFSALADGDQRRSWELIRASFRLANHYANDRPTLISFLIASAKFMSSTRSLLTLLTRTEGDTELLAEIDQFLQQHRSTLLKLTAAATGERMFALECACRLLRSDQEELQSEFPDDWKWLARGSLDRNAALRRLNQQYDSLGQVVAMPIGRRRTATLLQFQNAQQKRRDDLKTMTSRARLAMDRAERSRAITDLVTTDAYGSWSFVNERDQTQYALIEIARAAVAAKRYHLQRGSYPINEDALKELAPSLDFNHFQYENSEGTICLRQRKTGAATEEAFEFDFNRELVPFRSEVKRVIQKQLDDLQNEW